MIATQDYFDQRGVFAGLLFSAPLLGIGFLQLLILLYQTSTMLIKLKRTQLRANLRKEREKTD
jgi:hypothetical protein